MHRVCCGGVLAVAHLPPLRTSAAAPHCTSPGTFPLLAPRLCPPARMLCALLPTVRLLTLLCAGCVCASALLISCLLRIHPGMR